mgnify:CR=1 FL=1
MIHFLLSLALITNVFAFGGKPKPEPTPSPIPTPSEAYTGVPEGLEPELRIQFSPIINYGPKETENLKIAEKLANTVVQSTCFERFMLARKMNGMNGKTRQQVVDHLRSTKLTVPVKMYYTSKNVIGYRQPPSPTVHTNRKYHGVNSGKSNRYRASNLTHEWSHVLGYKHAFRNPSQYSVPYSITAAFNACMNIKGELLN